MRIVRTMSAGALALAIVLACAGVASASPSNLACSSGDIASGTYQSITVTGFCTISDGAVVTVKKNFTIAPGALLDAVSNSNLTVWGNMVVEKGAALGLGCNVDSVGPPCTENTTDEIHGNLIGDEANALIVHSTTVDGNLSVQGGGGGVNCDPSPALLQDPNTAGSPAFFAYEDGSVGGNASVQDLQTCWAGLLRVTVGRNAIVSNNTFADPDAPEVGSNTVGHNLICNGNSPSPVTGDGSGGNTAGHKKIGQCATL